MTSLVGKVIAVTGAASGIGRGTARLLASRGASLALTDVQCEPLDEVAGLIRKEGGTCLSMVVDVRESGMVNSWIDQGTEHLGNLDGAVNCAGVRTPFLNSVTFLPRIGMSEKPSLHSLNGA